MIHSVRFHNFKAVRDARIRLERLTVLVGPNASGKTSVLQGLKWISELGGQPVWKVFEGRRAPGVLFTKGASDDMVLGFKVETTGHVDWNFTPVPKEGGTQRWAVTVDGEWGAKPIKYGPVTFPFASKPKSELDEPGKLEFSAALTSTVFLRLAPAQLAEPTPGDTPWTYLAEDGKGLASVLAEIATTNPKLFSELAEAVRAVVPPIEEIRLARVQVEKESLKLIQEPATPPPGIAPREQEHYKKTKESVWGYELVVDMKGAPSIPAHALSEGTLITIGLLTALMSPQRRRPQLVLLDNLEAGLHPKALGDLIAQLRRMLDQFPDMQIVATSHSPYMLDHVKPEEVRVSTLTSEGHALFGRLTDHPEFEKWKDVMSPGEFWSSFGEKWLNKEARTENV